MSAWDLCSMKLAHPMCKEISNPRKSVSDGPFLKLAKQ